MKCYFLQLGVTITEITATVLAQEAQEADSIKMLNKTLDRFMDPIFINKILEGINKAVISIILSKTSLDTGKYKERGLNENLRLPCFLRVYLARCTGGLILRSCSYTLRMTCKTTH